MASARTGTTKKLGLAAFDFTDGTLTVTEAGTKRRASLQLLRGAGAVTELDRGGLEVLATSLEAFGGALRRENRTLKRALTHPDILAGIGNAYSDEILHWARLSPLRLTQSLKDDEMERLREAAIAVLDEWSERLKAEARKGFPEKVTAFRPEMSVHGRFGLACPVCGTAVQRIRYAENECNYCPECQTDGRILADRALSRLLKDDRPKTVSDLKPPSSVAAASAAGGAARHAGARRRPAPGRSRSS